MEERLQFVARRLGTRISFPSRWRNYILNVKREHSSWGARKIRERLIRRFSGIPIPAKSTIHLPGGQPSFSPTAFTFTARAASSTIVRQSRKED
jgi:hypothetical protein